MLGGSAPAECHLRPPAASESGCRVDARMGFARTMLAPRCGRALQAGLFVRRRDNLRLLCAWWTKGSAGVPHPTV
uniref:Uncharacterized protein n=1 Tax=Cucumis melo TaxID=3656 RepID=A0A9I9CC88_CUCME